MVLQVNADAQAGYEFQAVLRKEIRTDHNISLASVLESENAAIATWSNGTVVAIAPKSPGAAISVTESTVSIEGRLSGRESGAEILLIPANSRDEALAKVRLFRAKADLEGAAGRYWNAWMDSGKLPLFKSGDPQAARYLEAFKRNLYCVKSAELNGRIPADITGQFVTNGMPQLYPRDAMMCARVLLLSGHAEEARQVIEFWAKPQVPMKTRGEWYARYDAHGKAVDAGSGARFDEPEWDSNGYYIYLLDQYHSTKGVWLADAKFLYELADFLVDHISFEDCSRIREREEVRGLRRGGAENFDGAPADVRSLAADVWGRSIHWPKRSEWRKSCGPLGREALSLGHYRQCRSDLGLPESPRP